MTVPFSAPESWDLDAVGNWDGNTLNGTTTSRTNSAQNQVSTSTTDLGGGVSTSATLAYDANGNTLTDNTLQQYVYDAWNRLVTVKDALGTTIAAYTYDAQGRRVTETHGSTTTDLYYNANWQLIEERDAATGTTTTQYVWSPFYVDQLVERDDHAPATTSTALNRRLYVEQDADYNVTSLTDASGAVVERYAYDPYGAVTVENADGSIRGSGSTYGWVYLYQGARVDVSTNTYDKRTRVYLVALGRFAQPDSAGYIDGANSYQFLTSSPLTSVDPAGTSKNLLKEIVHLIDPSIPPLAEHEADGQINKYTVDVIEARLQNEVLQLDGSNSCILSNSAASVQNVVDKANFPGLQSMIDNEVNSFIDPALRAFLGLKSNASGPSASGSGGTGGGAGGDTGPVPGLKVSPDITPKLPSKLGKLSVGSVIGKAGVKLNVSDDDLQQSLEAAATFDKNYPDNIGLLGSYSCSLVSYETGNAYQLSLQATLQYTPSGIAGTGRPGHEANTEIGFKLVLKH